MARVAAIGESLLVEGFGLAGAMVFPAPDAQSARDAWRCLAPDVAVVLLTPRAAGWIGQDAVPRDVLVVVMPS